MSLDAKAHQTIQYAAATGGGTIAIPAVAGITPPSGSNGTFIVTALMAEGVCVTTLDLNGTVQMIVRSAAATNTETVPILGGLRLAPTYAAPINLTGVGAGTARVVGYWD